MEAQNETRQTDARQQCSNTLRVLDMWAEGKVEKEERQEFNKNQ